MNGKGTGSYNPKEVALISASAPSAANGNQFEFAGWLVLRGDGKLDNAQSESTSYTMGEEDADLVAVYARTLTWFPPAGRSQTEGILLPEPSGDESRRMEIKVGVEFHHGNSMATGDDLLGLLEAKFEWENAELLEFFDKEKEGNSLENASTLDKTLFSEKDKDIYEVSLWYEGRWKTKDYEDKQLPEASTTTTLTFANNRESTPAKTTLLPFDIAVDANRDGEVIMGSSSDATTQEKPFVFWVNDDFDRDNEEETSGTADWNDGLIQCIRDLEDFSRIVTIQVV